MRCLLFLVIFASIFGIVVSAQSQIYEYRGPDGTKRFTDDLGNVPPDQREHVEMLDVIPVVPSSSEQPEVAAAAGDADESIGNDDAGLAENAKRLIREREALGEEHERIQKAKEDLGDPPPRTSGEEYATYERRVEEINRWIGKYREKVEDHERRVQQHNEMVNR